jgi:hypothetical protein
MHCMTIFHLLPYSLINPLFSQFDALATHFYGTDADALIAYLKDLHDTFNLPIWLTEFACQVFALFNLVSVSCLT